MIKQFAWRPHIYLKGEDLQEFYNRFAQGRIDAEEGYIGWDEDGKVRVISLSLNSEQGLEGIQWDEEDDHIEAESRGRGVRHVMVKKY